MNKGISEYQFMSKLKDLPFVDQIWLFGSRARGDHQQRSDIDLAIICPKASRLDWLKVLDIIEDADTLLKIDCLRFEKEKLGPALVKNILNDKKVLYDKSLH